MYLSTVLSTVSLLYCTLHCISLLYLSTVSLHCISPLYLSTNYLSTVSLLIWYNTCDTINSLVRLHTQRLKTTSITRHMESLARKGAAKSMHNTSCTENKQFAQGDYIHLCLSCVCVLIIILDDRHIANSSWINICTWFCSHKGEGGTLQKCEMALMWMGHVLKWDSHTD